MRTDISRLQTLALVAIVLLASAALAIGQIAAESSAKTTVVPQITRYSGVAAETPAGTAEMVFHIYAAAEGGEALWTETQQVVVGADGKYTVLLGAVVEGGLPPSVFAGGQARWLGVAVGGAVEQPRVPLDSAAYAMKAADAETLGGVPAAEFVTQTQLRASPETVSTTATGSAKSTKAAHPNDIGGSGAANTIPIWTDSGNLGNSALSQSGNNINATGSITGNSNSTTTWAAGLYGMENAATGEVSGVQGGTSSTTTGSAGVNGFEHATKGQVYGVWGNTSSTGPGAAGVYGQDYAVTGQVYGLSGLAGSTTDGAAGVNGSESAATGAVSGVGGSANSTTQGAAGVSGWENATTGAVYGVSGSTNSNAGVGGFYPAGVIGYEGSATGAVWGVDGQTNSIGANSAGVRGYEGGATGVVYGVTGSTSSTTDGAVGVYGYEGATTGEVSGVSGSTSSVTFNSAGVGGWEGAATGQVWGVSGGTSSTGVSGSTMSAGGAAGVNGWEGATTGLVSGVRGSTASTGADSAGIYGWEYATTGQVYGVSGQSDSVDTGAAGVYGSETAATGSTIGVEGVSASTTGVGVLGKTTAAGATAGEFVNAAGSGLVLEGLSKSTKVFSVDTSGNGVFAGNLTVNGTSLNKAFAQLGVANTFTAANTFTKPITFAAGQTFPSTGTISGVTATSPLTGGGTSGAVTVGLNTTALKTTLNGVYAQLGAANTFTAANTFAKPITFAAGQKFSGADTGTGTANTIAMWTGSGTLGNSALTQSGNNISAVGSISGNSNSTTQYASSVSGYESAATGQVYGVSGTTSSNGINSAGVNGGEWSPTGKVYGVEGQTSSSGTDAAGVLGGNWGNSGVTYGVSGWDGSVTTGAAGVKGTAGATTGAVSGVLGTTPSTSGTGVLGMASAVTGATVGVEGQSASTTGVGVLGKTTAAGAIAGEFVNAAGSGLILEGLSKSTKVFSVDASGNGVYAGNLTVTGKLVKGSGSFKIDHPLDPANKYLSHSFVESPDMMNVYNGNITTDKHGVATVTLPEYFEALNRDFRYQLTVIGQFAQAIVGQKIANNRFVIRTSKPGVEVSWQVTGIRQDAYANVNRIPVEEVKPAGEQGTYLHPEAFGQPASKSVADAGQPASSSSAMQASYR